LRRRPDAAAGVSSMGTSLGKVPVNKEN
jgi:hypothetical protein